ADTSGGYTIANFPPPTPPTGGAPPAPTPPYGFFTVIQSSYGSATIKDSAPGPGVPPNSVTLTPVSGSSFTSFTVAPPLTPGTIRTQLDAIVPGTTILVGGASQPIILTALAKPVVTAGSATLTVSFPAGMTQLPSPQPG